MAFIDTVPSSRARGDVLAMYARQQAALGFVPNYAKVFSLRPEVMECWARLLSAIRRPMPRRRFELVTLAAAHALKNTYCSLAHGEALTEFLEPAVVRSIVSGEFGNELSDAERAMIRFVQKVATDASRVDEDEVQALRSHGFSDDEIFDIVATGAARSFFTKLLDGLGVEADTRFLSMDADLRQSLVTGRPIATTAPETIPVNRSEPAAEATALSEIG